MNLMRYLLTQAKITLIPFGINAQNTITETSILYNPKITKKIFKEYRQNTYSKIIVSISKKSNRRGQYRLSGMLQPTFYYIKKNRRLEAGSVLEDLQQTYSRD
ncbi:hypothetical protein BB561_005682 [Smittium simulii]|uniref:Uncharacterized protein n=1 Tax=Smittium simulii TaxID=133385 RepID=A0A2T9Y929_9FUNG|nr:hypothetical protein BB561_005682 [Smittium simulii]